MQFENFGFPGAFLVYPRAFTDDRGSFVKTFHAPDFHQAGLRSDWREEFYSTSSRGVVRGMHFQSPPAHHAKLVTCLAGSVMDVAVDLRRGSPTEGEWRSVVLDADNALGLYLPSGIAHGFQAIGEPSLMLYKVTSVHAPDHDGGIAWDSFGFEWPVADPIVSARDRAHPAIDAFESPFVFDPDAAAQ